MDIQQATQRLHSLGLSEKQAKTYIATLYLGKSGVQKIAGSAGISRPTAYDILDELTTLGLVYKTNVSKRAMFTAADPHVLTDMLKLQADEVFRRRSSLQDLLPELEAMQRPAKAPAVRFISGQEAAIAAEQVLLAQEKQSGSPIVRSSNLPVDIIVHQDTVILRSNQDPTSPEGLVIEHHAIAQTLQLLCAALCR
jgi:sugar-specific transcriptional regulator TrmB